MIQSKLTNNNRCVIEPKANVVFRGEGASAFHPVVFDLSRPIHFAQALEPLRAKVSKTKQQGLLQMGV